MVTCPEGHELDEHPAPRRGLELARCDRCHVGVTPGRKLHGCRDCNYDLCGQCFEEVRTTTTIPAPSGGADTHSAQSLLRESRASLPSDVMLHWSVTSSARSEVLAAGPQMTKCANPYCAFQVHSRAGHPPTREHPFQIPAEFCCAKCWTWLVCNYKRGVPSTHGIHCEKADYIEPMSSRVTGGLMYPEAS